MLEGVVTLLALPPLFPFLTLLPHHPLLSVVVLPLYAFPLVVPISLGSLLFRGCVFVNPFSLGTHGFGGQLFPIVPARRKA